MLSASGSLRQQGNIGGAADGATYQWGVNGHPISMTTSGTGTLGGTQSGNESLFWDGDSLLYTLAGSTLDDVKIGNLGDFTPSDPGYKGITFWDRGPGGSVSYCHNATGTAGNGDIDPYVSQGKWSGGIVNPCALNAGSSSMPSRIVWNSSWSGQTYGGGQVPAVGAGWTIGEMRSDGIQDGVNTTQGVRAYDPNANQWTTPDAYAGDVHDPVTQKSYMWNNNNPVSYEDPSGYTGALVLGGLGGGLAEAFCIVAEPCGLLEGIAIVAGGITIIVLATVPIDKLPKSGIQYYPPKMKGVKAGTPVIVKAPNGKRGALDRYGNIWIWDPIKKEWDVQHKGGDDHTNVNPEGSQEPTHGENNFPKGSKNNPAPPGAADPPSGDSSSDSGGQSGTGAPRETGGRGWEIPNGWTE